MTANRSLPSITVIGSINIDFSVVAPRLPAPGESVVGTEFLQAFGGKGANQAVGISRLTDHGVRFVGAVGDDELGRAGMNSLRENRVDTQYVQVVTGANTGVALIMIDAAGENCIAAAPGANASVDPDFVASLPDELFASSAMMVICQEIPVESIELVVKRSKDQRIPVLFNPAPPNPRLLESDVLCGVDYLTPNETETAAITGLNANELNQMTSRRLAMDRLIQLGPASVAMTLGAAGCLAFDAKRMDKSIEMVLVETPQVNAVDTTAAGDSFNAALAVGLVEGRSFVEACKWANRVAAISVTRRGAQTSLPYRHEVPAIDS